MDDWTKQIIESLNKSKEEKLAKSQGGRGRDQVPNFFGQGNASDSNRTSNSASSFFPSSPIMQHLFGSNEEPKRRRSLDDLKYLDAYPLRVKKWVIDAKTPRGYYSPSGQWIRIEEKGRELETQWLAEKIALDNPEARWRVTTELKEDLDIRDESGVPETDDEKKLVIINERIG